MLTPGSEQRIYLATAPVDMRGGFDRLAGRVRSVGLDLYGGHLFIFVSRRRTHLKVLTWDGSGLVVLYKRLGKGRFVLPSPLSDAGTMTLDAKRFAELLRGSDTLGVRRSKSARSRQAHVDSETRA